MITRRIVASLLALVVTPGVTAAKCEEHETHPSAPRAPGPEHGGPPAPQITVPEPKEGDPQPHDRHYILVRAGGIEESGRPWTLTVTARGKGGVIADTQEIVTGKDHPTVRIAYTDEDKPINVVVEVKPARAGSKNGYCGIEWPDGHDGPRYIAGAWRAQCYATVK